MHHQKVKSILIRLYTILGCTLIFSVFSFAQTSKQELADSLYFKTGFYEQASKLYLELASEWESQGFMDSAFHKYLFAIKALGQANQIERALQFCDQVLAKMKKYPQPSMYLADIYYEKGYCEFVMGDRSKSINSFNISLEEEDKKQQPDSLKIAGILQFKGLALLQSGEIEQGKEIVHRAHDIRTLLLEKDHIDLAQSANMLYMIYDHLYQYQQADQYISEAYRIMKKHLEPDHPHFAIVINNYSNVRRNLGDPFHSKDLLFEAIASNERARRWYPLTMNYYNLADLYFDFGEYDLSDLYFIRSFEMGDTLLANPSLERANLYDGMGKIAFQFGRLNKASDFFNLALQQGLQLVGEQSLEVAQSYHNLGLIAYSQKKYHEAMSHFVKSIQIRSQQLNPSHPLVMESEVELGDCLWELGQKEEAFEKWERSLESFSEVLGRSSPRVVNLAIHLAKFWQNENKAKKAEFYLQYAWSGVAPVPEGNKNWSIEKAGKFQVFHLATFELVDAQLSFLLDNSPTGMNAAKETFYFTQGIINRFNDFLIEMLPLLNAQQAGPELRDLLQNIYSNAALLVHRSKSSNSNEACQFYLNCLENSKAFSIRTQLQNKNALSFSKIPDSLRLHGQYLQSRSWAINAFKASGEELTKDLIQQEVEIQTAWNKWQQQLASRYPEYYKLRYAKPQLDFLALEKKLQKEDQSLLGYFLCNQSMLAISFDGKQFLTKELSIDQGQMDSIARFNQLLSQRDFSKHLPQLAYYLYQSFFQVVEKGLSKKVLIFPDGALSNLNFDLLLQNLPEEKSSYAEMDWLIKTYQFQYANHLQNSNVSTKYNQYNLALAPGFSPELKKKYLSFANQQYPPDSIFLNWVSTPWSIDLVQELERKGWGKILTDTSATKSRFLSLSKNSNILHFATHAEVNDNNPLQSFLALTPSIFQKDDGYLYASDLYGLDLNSKLVVLSACQTGLGRFKKGEGVLSLAHAFQYAGVPAMVYSLWSIDDQQTNWLIEEFYKELEQGKSISEALRAAKKNYLMTYSEELSHPYYWGGMIMMGNDRVIFPKNSSLFLWTYLSGFLIVIGTLYYFFKKR